jgi:hypothetical protein
VATEPADQTNDLLKELVKLTTGLVETQKRALNVARFGPNAGAGGGGGAQQTKKAPTPEEMAQRIFDARQTWMRERGSALHQVGLQSAGSAYHRASSMAEGFQGLGLNRMGGLVQRAALPLAVASGVGSMMNTIGQVARIHHNPFATNEEKGRALFRMLPGGETTQQFFDSITGREARMQTIEKEGRQAMAQARGEQRITSVFGSLEPGQQGRGAFATSFIRQQLSGAAGAAFHPVMDRSSARGDVAFQNEMKLIPARKELLRTERELAKATSERQASEQHMKTISNKQLELSKDRARVERELTQKQNQSGPNRFRKQNELARILQEQQAYAEQQASHSQSLTGARQAEAQAKGAVGAAQAGMKRAEADVKQSAADRSMGTARTLGEMEPLQRQQGMNVLKMLQEGANPDLLPAEIKSLARQVAPAEYDKIISRHGAQTETFQAGKQAGLVGFEGDPFQLQKEADQLRREGDEGEFKAEGQAAQEVADAGRGLANTIKSYVEKMIEAVKREIENELQMGTTRHS